MPWGKLDDKLHDHPKVEALEDRGPMALWTRAMSWSSEKLTDGRVPAGWVKARFSPAAVRKLLDVVMLHGPSDTCTNPTCPASIEPVPAGHYQLHDYWQCNPSAEHELARRKTNAENGAKGAGQRQANRLAKRQPNGEANRQPTRSANDDAPLPVPRIPTADISEPPPPENTQDAGGGGPRDQHPSRPATAIDHQLSELIRLASGVEFAASSTAHTEPTWRLSCETRIRRDHGTAWRAAIENDPDVDEALLIQQDHRESIDTIRSRIRKYRREQPPQEGAA